MTGSGTCPTRAGWTEISGETSEADITAAQDEPEVEGKAGTDRIRKQSDGHGVGVSLVFEFDVPQLRAAFPRPAAK